jgi:polar amino acid transport system substrate-binding protein
MVNDDRHSLLSSARKRVAVFLVLTTALLQGCGYLIDGIEWLLPKESSHDAVCSRENLSIALSAGPYPPFVFPVMETPQGPRVTGFDIDLIRAVERELQEHCGKAIRPAVRLVPFLDLFALMQERKVDLFISATPANVAGAGRGGLAYTLPYFSTGGLTVVARTPEIADVIRQRLTAKGVRLHASLTRLEAMSGFRMAVVDGSSGAAYAAANATTDRFVVCNTLNAAFHAETSVGEPADLIIGSSPVLISMARRHLHEWTVVTLDGNQPLLLTHENFSMVVREDRLHLLWFLNNLLFRLEESGELTRLRDRWLNEEYDARLRAADEGLPVSDQAKREQERRSCYVGHSGFGRLRTLARE